MLRLGHISLKIAPYLVLFILTLLAVQALLTNAFYTSHDGWLHVTRMAAYSNALRDGQFPPRWATNFNGGMGSPIFVYIYPLPYALGALTHRFGLSFISSFQFWMIVSTFISAFAMYAWLRLLYTRAPSLLGAVAYIWVPYRFLNMYVRAAYAEHLAFALPPLAFYFLERLLTSSKKWIWWALFSLSVGALLLMHTQIAAFTLPLLLCYTVIRIGVRKNKATWIYFLGAVVAAGGMASFIYLPDFLERHLINFDSGFTFYQEYFVAPLQLLNSPWGYGFDLPGVIHDAMSFKIGQTQIAAAIGSALVLLFYLIVKKKHHDHALALFFLLVWLTAVFLMTDTMVVRFVWQYLPLIKTIVDYPWRLFFLVVFSSSFLLAFVLSKVRFQWLAATVLILFLVISNRNHRNINLPLTSSDQEIQSYWGSGTAASNEYKPNIHRTEKIVERKTPVEVIEGTATLRASSQTAKGLTFSLFATDSGTVRVNRFSFPTTNLYKNGSLLTEGKDYWVIVPTKESKTLDDTGLIMVRYTPSEGSYELRFEDSPLRNVANGISLVTFIVVCGILAYAMRKYRGGRNK